MKRSHTGRTACVSRAFSLLLHATAELVQLFAARAAQKQKAPGTEQRVAILVRLCAPARTAPAPRRTTSSGETAPPRLATAQGCAKHGMKKHTVVSSHTASHTAL